MTPSRGQAGLVVQARGPGSRFRLEVQARGPGSRSRSLRSSGLLVVPRVRTETYGEAGFSVYGSRLWNSLPEKLSHTFVARDWASVFWEDRELAGLPCKVFFRLNRHRHSERKRSTWKGVQQAPNTSTSVVMIFSSRRLRRSSLRMVLKCRVTVQPMKQ
ncbi:hypothetical protein N1851_012936 [Merluccius polli]|uniref:Uncharacterized protein n=1 Tax=Merluccius polli TaxID=89951 RepID=A0AA47MVZ9_MERPO|nr:hypothetical protein N1851_012936 [Merluccius polli]